VYPTVYPDCLFNRSHVLGTPWDSSTTSRSRRRSRVTRNICWRTARACTFASGQPARYGSIDTSRAGTEAKLSLGHYPAVSLAAARKRSRAEAEKRGGRHRPKRGAPRRRRARARCAPEHLRTDCARLACPGTEGSPVVGQLCREGDAASGVAHLPVDRRADHGKRCADGTGALPPSHQGARPTSRRRSGCARRYSTCTSTPSTWGRWSRPGIS